MKIEMRSLLIGKRNEFLSQLQVAQIACSQAQTGFTVRTHPADREDNPEIFSVNVVRIKYLENCLTKVNRALERLDNNNGFGYCDDCGKKIPLKRLKILPFVEFCVDCKAQAEKNNPLS